MEYRKHKNAERARAIDDMMAQWCDPKMVSAGIGISANIALKYIYALGYQRRYITQEEMQLITKYRMSKINATK